MEEIKTYTVTVEVQIVAKDRAQARRRANNLATAYGVLDYGWAQKAKAVSIREEQ